jgi:hypothetical protein
MRCTRPTAVTIGKDSLSIVKCLALNLKSEVAGGFVIPSCDGLVGEVIVRTDLEETSVNNYFANEISFHTHPHVNSPSSQDLWVAVIRSQIAVHYLVSMVFDHAGVYIIFVDPEPDVRAIQEWLLSKLEVWKSSKKPQRHIFTRVVNSGLKKHGLTVKFKPWKELDQKLQVPSVHLNTTQDGDLMRFKHRDIPSGLPLVLGGINGRRL